MGHLPELLSNPINRSFNLVEMEVYNLKEALELIEIEKLSFSIFVIWQCVISNIQRRVEAFNIDSFILSLKNKEQYNKDSQSQKERWLNINEYELIDFAQKSSVITKVTANLVKTLYWMKSSNGSEKIITKEEIYSLVYLLEQNLFLSTFKSDQRGKRQNGNSNYKRRKEDEELEMKSSTTHQELVLRNGIKHFKESLITNNKNDTLLTAYI